MYPITTINPGCDHLVCCLHGYNSNNQIMSQTLAPLVQAHPSTTFVFIESTTAINYVTHSSAVSPQALKQWLPLTSHKPTLKTACQPVVERLEQTINHLSNTQDCHSLSLLGYSQGAAIALEWLLTTRFTLRNLVLFAPLQPDAPERYREKINELNVTLIHGKQDRMIQWQETDNLAQSLKSQHVCKFVLLEQSGHALTADTVNQTLSALPSFD